MNNLPPRQSRRQAKLVMSKNDACAVRLPIIWYGGPLDEACLHQYESSSNRWAINIHFTIIPFISHDGMHASQAIPLLLSRSPHFACTYLFYFLIYVVSFVFCASWHQYFLSSRHLGTPAFFQTGLAYCSSTDHAHSFLSLTLHQLPINPQAFWVRFQSHFPLFSPTSSFAIVGTSPSPVTGIRLMVAACYSQMNNCRVVIHCPWTDPLCIGLSLSDPGFWGRTARFK